MFLRSSFNYINEFYFIFKNEIRKIYLKSSIYNKKISKVDENVLVYHPSHNILSSLINYEKQKKKIDGLMNPDDIAQNYLMIHNQPKNSWTFEIDLRPWVETW